MVKALGRKIPTDFVHVDKYPLKLAALPPKPVPIAVGINWYGAFDRPVKKGNQWWAGLDPKNLGKIRGGHCVCMPFDPAKDLASWYPFYDQGEEGACVGFGSSRMMSLLNRKKYNAHWLWEEAKEIDEFPETHRGDNEGTSVRAAMDILRLMGHMCWFPHGKTYSPCVDDGISANRWATNVDDMLEVLQNPKFKKVGAIPFLNSWGKDYPHITWVPCETWERLLKEDGEFTMVTDR